jgi:hypothetical protein
MDEKIPFLSSNILLPQENSQLRTHGRMRDIEDGTVGGGGVKDPDRVVSCQGEVNILFMAFDRRASGSYVYIQSSFISVILSNWNR